MNDADRDKLLERAVTALEALAKLPAELKATRVTIAKHSDQIKDALHGVRAAVGEVRDGLKVASDLAAIGAADDDDFSDLLADLPADNSDGLAHAANRIAEEFPDLPDLGDLEEGPDAPAGDNGATDAAAGGSPAAATASVGGANATVGDASGTASGTTAPQPVAPSDAHTDASPPRSPSDAR